MKWMKESQLLRESWDCCWRVYFRALLRWNRTDPQAHISMYIYIYSSGIGTRTNSRIVHCHVWIAGWQDGKNAFRCAMPPCPDGNYSLLSAQNPRRKPLQCNYSQKYVWFDRFLFGKGDRESPKGFPSMAREVAVWQFPGSLLVKGSRSNRNIERMYWMGFRLAYLQHHTLMWCFVCCALHLRFVLRPRVHGRELTLQDYGIDPWSTLAQRLRAQVASATASDGLIQLRAIVTAWVTGQKVTVKVHFFEMGGVVTM